MPIDMTLTVAEASQSAWDELWHSDDPSDRDLCESWLVTLENLSTDELAIFNRTPVFTHLHEEYLMACTPTTKRAAIRALIDYTDKVWEAVREYKRQQQEDKET